MQKYVRSMKKISIVTVCLNSEAFIEQTINAVLSQNYPELEYIVVDGGSTDNTVNIIKKYTDKISHFVSEPDDGMYHALKKGFGFATGEIMAWINAGDILFPGAFHSVNRIFTEFTDCLWLTGFPTVLNAGGSVFPARLIHLERLYRDFEFLNGSTYCVQQESTFFKKSLYDAVGGISTEYKLAGDYDLWAKFFQKTKLYVFNCLIGSFRVHSMQLSSDKALYKNELTEIRTRYNKVSYKLKYLYFKLVAVYCKLLPAIIGRRILSACFQSNRYYYDKKNDKFYHI